MTDEVFSDNLDEAPEADLEAVAAVEELQAEGESVPEVAEAEPTAEATSEESAEDEGGEELDAGAKPSKTSPTACAPSKASGTCCTPTPAMRSV